MASKLFALIVSILFAGVVNGQESTALPSVGACPNNFLELNGRCYLFSEMLKYDLAFDDARTYCQSFTIGDFNYDLLILNDDIEEPVVVAQEMLKRRYFNATIGGNDLGLSDPHWAWVDGSGIGLQSPSWDCGYPISETYTNVLHFDYVRETLPSQNVQRFRFRDIPRDTPSYFICEGDFIGV